MVAKKRGHGGKKWVEKAKIREVKMDGLFDAEVMGT
jgi:hypothetical protein